LPVLPAGAGALCAGLAKATTIRAGASAGVAGGVAAATRAGGASAHAAPANAATNTTNARAPVRILVGRLARSLRTGGGGLGADGRDPAHARIGTQARRERAQLWAELAGRVLGDSGRRHAEHAGAVRTLDHPRAGRAQQCLDLAHRQ